MENFEVGKCWLKFVLQNIYPWKIFTPEKYSPLKRFPPKIYSPLWKIHLWKVYTSEKIFTLEFGMIMQVAAKLESYWKAAEKKATNHEWLTSVVPLEKIFTPKNSPLKEITSEKYSPLKNIQPLKKYLPWKYSPIKNIQ